MKDGFLEVDSIDASGEEINNTEGHGNALSLEKGSRFIGNFHGRGS